MKAALGDNIDIYLQDFFSAYGNDRRYWIAYSGGLDSHVLLHACNKLKPAYQLQLQAIHVNHGLSPNANSWMQHCSDICTQFGIKLNVNELQLQAMRGRSMEAAAREERYTIFSRYLKVGDILLSAHHQDDQAETVLLQLLRGSGLKGLAAMPFIKPLAKGLHARPFLHLSRESLRRYAQINELKWIEDESNQNETLTRNFIRHQVAPILKQRFPHFGNTLARSALHCAEAQELLDELTKENLNRVRGTNNQNLSVKKLLQFSPEKQKLLLRSWILEQGFSLPSTKKIQAIVNDALTAAYDRKPTIHWHATELRRFKDDLFLFSPLTQHDKTAEYKWDLKEFLQIPGVGKIQVKSSSQHAFSSAITEVHIRFRRGGEWIHLPGRGHHSLKKLFQEWKVPTWERDRIPLVYSADKLMAVVGYCVDSAFKASPGESGYELTLIPDKLRIDTVCKR